VTGDRQPISAEWSQSARDTADDNVTGEVEDHGDASSSGGADARLVGLCAAFESIL